MRDRRFLIGAIALGVVLIVALVLVYFFLGNKNEELASGDVFPSAEDATPGSTDTATEGELNREFWESEDHANDALPILRALSDNPVAGVVTLVRTSGSEYLPQEYARYVERSSGHILETPLARVENSTTLSGETMLRIGRVFWSRNGSTTLLQRLDPKGTIVYSYLGSFSVVGTSTTLGTVESSGAIDFKGRHLEYGDIRTAAISPDGRSIFYIVATERGSVGYLEDVVSGTRRPIWNSLLTNLTASWGGDHTVSIYTNPSSVAQGVVWTLNTLTGASSLVLGNEFALAARMSPIGDRLLYSLQETSGGVTSLRVLTMDSGTVMRVPSGVVSLVEKCAWDTVRTAVIYCAVPRNLTEKDYLENWQYGLLASDDVVWQIHTETGEAQRVLDPVELTTDSFDIVDLEVSPLGDFLVFRNRTNDILWSAQIPASLLPQNDSVPGASTTPPTL